VRLRSRRHDERHFFRRNPSVVSNPLQAEPAFSANFEGGVKQVGLKFKSLRAVRCALGEGWFARPRRACYDARSNVKGSRFCVPAEGFPYSFPK